ncbi:MAG: hypothetical protein Q9184_001086 [Pyrenodesmia sp. 2 TL-2023]
MLPGINCAMHHDRFVANGKFVHFRISLGQTSYSISLGDPWLRSVNARSIDSTHIYHRLDYSGLTSTFAPEILLAGGVDWKTLRMEENMLYDLSLWRTRCEIHNEIMAQVYPKQRGGWEEEMKYEQQLDDEEVSQEKGQR